MSSSYCFLTVLDVQHVSTVDVKKLLKAKSVITASCSFVYLDERLTIDFRSSDVTYKPCAVKFFFRKQAIASVNYAFNNRKYKPSELFSSVLSFRNTPIDFFGFAKDRIFTIFFEFEANGEKLRSDFSVALPVVKQTEMFFKPPGTTFPDAITRKICQQAFNLNSDNSHEEVQRCIYLEEFKLLPAVERYKAYGYVSMLSLFLDIENSFELELVKKFSLDNVQLFHQSQIHYRIDVS